MMLRACCGRLGGEIARNARPRFQSSAASASEAFVRTEAGLQDLYMRALEPKPTPLPVVSPQQLAANKDLAETFSQLKMKRAAVMGKDLKRKLDLKWAAFHALPSAERKAEALFIRPHVPLHRRVPTATPPSYGFHGKPMEAAASKGEGGEKQGKTEVVRKARSRRGDDVGDFGFGAGAAPASSGAGTKRN